MNIKQAAASELYYQYEIQLIEVETLIKNYTDRLNNMPTEGISASIIQTSRRNINNKIAQLTTRQDGVTRNLENLRSYYEDL